MTGSYTVRMTGSYTVRIYAFKRECMIESEISQKYGIMGVNLFLKYFHGEIHLYVEN